MIEEKTILLMEKKTIILMKLRKMEDKTSKKYL